MVDTNEGNKIYQIKGVIDTYKLELIELLSANDFFVRCRCRCLIIAVNCESRVCYVAMRMLYAVLFLLFLFSPEFLVRLCCCVLCALLSSFFSFFNYSFCRRKTSHSRFNSLSVLVLVLVPLLYNYTSVLTVEVVVK